MIKFGNFNLPFGRIRIAKIIIKKCLIFFNRLDFKTIASFTLIRIKLVTMSLCNLMSKRGNKFYTKLFIRKYLN